MQFNGRRTVYPLFRKKGLLTLTYPNYSIINPSKPG
jgi:hypothetical protein